MLHRGTFDINGLSVGALKAPLLCTTLFSRSEAFFQNGHAGDMSFPGGGDGGGDHDDYIKFSLIHFLV